MYGSTNLIIRFHRGDYLIFQIVEKNIFPDHSRKAKKSKGVPLENAQKLPKMHKN